MSRRVVFSILLCLGLGLASAPAEARSICADLAARIQNGDVTIGDTATMRKYARAITRQKLAIRQAQAERRRQGCGAGSIELIGVTDDPCGKFDEALDRMNANLDNLVAQRESLLVRTDDSASRARLMARFEAMGCSQEAEGINLDKPGQPLVQDDADAAQVNVALNDPSRETIRVPDDYSANRFVDLGGADTRGGLKTVCVRACDGGFFPISNHASPTAFKRDAQVCSMMCPGVETELFYMPLMSDDTASMRSTVTGRRYEDSPKAFAFRTAPRDGANKACGCNIALYTREMMRREAAINKRMSVPADAAAVNPQETAITWVKPALRPTLGAEDAARVDTATRIADRPWLPSRKIRKVGPDFILPERIDFSRTVEERLMARVIETRR